MKLLYIGLIVLIMVSLSLVLFREYNLKSTIGELYDKCSDCQRKLNNNELFSCAIFVLLFAIGLFMSFIIIGLLIVEFIEIMFIINGRIKELISTEEEIIN